MGLSFMLTWAPQLWPQTAQDWYAKYSEQFWQEGLFFAGFREFPKDIDVGWFNMSDVDAGPVVGGYGVAASAFGVGAARAMGRTDQAYKLAAQALVASWPLPDGTLLVPRVLSNVSDAPYLGEAATLFALTRTPVAQVQGDMQAEIAHDRVSRRVRTSAPGGCTKSPPRSCKLRRWRRGRPATLRAFAATAGARLVDSSRLCGGYGVALQRVDRSDLSAGRADSAVAAKAASTMTAAAERDAFLQSRRMRTLLQIPSVCIREAMMK